MNSVDNKAGKKGEQKFSAGGVGKPDAYIDQIM